MIRLTSHTQIGFILRILDKGITTVLNTLTVESSYFEDPG